MDTRWVYWKGKFGGERVLINAAAFDPAVHSDEPPAGEAKAPKKAKDA